MSKDVNQTTPSVDKSETNVNSVQAQGGGEGEHQRLFDLVWDVRHHNVTPEDALEEINKLTANRIHSVVDSVLADEEAQHIDDWLDELRTRDDCKLIAYGFNQAVDQWRTLLAKKRDTL